MGPQPEEISHQAFDAHLKNLKQRGSALLVVGNLTPSQYCHACHQMLGDASAATRRRLLVTTDRTTLAPEARLPTDGPPQAATTTHISYTAQSRSSTGEPSSPPHSLPTECIETPDLSKLAERLAGAIDEFQQFTPELAPAELRVCFDSLRPLFSFHDTNSVVQFVDRLTGCIRDVRGMGHFHLPATTERESVHAVASLFDVLVELRSDGETLQQRWRFPDKGLTSPWLPVKGD